MLTQNEKREALEKIREAVVAASRIMTGAVEIGAKTEAKSSPRDLVTAYDKAVEEYLVGALGHAFPRAKFLGEEGHGAFSAEGLLFIIWSLIPPASFFSFLRLLWLFRVFYISIQIVKCFVLIL